MRALLNAVLLRRRMIQYALNDALSIQVADDNLSVTLRVEKKIDNLQDIPEYVRFLQALFDLLILHYCMMSNYCLNKNQFF